MIYHDGVAASTGATVVHTVCPLTGTPGSVRPNGGGVSSRSRNRERVGRFLVACLAEREVAEVLGVTERTVQRHWVRARAWLHQEIYPEGGPA